MGRATNDRIGVRVRRLTGLVLIAAGVGVLYGLLFVPLPVILERPRMVPAPESWVALWLMGVGAVVVLWPARGSRRGDGGRPE